MSIKVKQIVYWTCLILTVVIMALSGFELIRQTHEEVLGKVNEMGYPLYFIRLLGIAKWIGIIPLLVPGFPRLREWAYAGFTINLMAAIYSHMAIGGFDVLAVVILVFLLISYYLGHNLKREIKPPYFM